MDNDAYAVQVWQTLSANQRLAIQIVGTACSNVYGPEMGDSVALRLFVDHLDQFMQVLVGLEGDLEEVVRGQDAAYHILSHEDQRSIIQFARASGRVVAHREMRQKCMENL